MLKKTSIISTLIILVIILTISCKKNNALLFTEWEAETSYDEAAAGSDDIFNCVITGTLHYRLRFDDEKCHIVGTNHASVTDQNNQTNVENIADDYYLEYGNHGRRNSEVVLWSSGTGSESLLFSQQRIKQNKGKMTLRVKIQNHTIDGRTVKSEWIDLEFVKK